MKMQKSRYMTDEERKEIEVLHDAGHTLTDIVEKTGRHHSIVSRILRSSTSLARPFQSKPRSTFADDEMKLLHELAQQGLTGTQIARRMPGRRKETINCKLQSLGYNRSKEMSEEKRQLVYNLRMEGLTVREIAEIAGVSKSAVATVVDPKPAIRAHEPVRTVADGIITITMRSGGYKVLVEEADAHLLPRSSVFKGANGYAMTRIAGKLVYLHHVIMGQPPVGKCVDHINGNRLDCRRSNLRFSTYSQNAQNAIRRGVGTSQFQGVKKTANGFSAAMMINLGTFKTAEEAARAYDEASKERHGEHAMTNVKKGLLKD